MSRPGQEELGERREMRRIERDAKRLAEVRKKNAELALKAEEERVEQE